jgi:hypothetical protein
METDTTPPQGFRKLLVNVLWGLAFFLLVGAMLLPVYYWLSCPTTPDPTTGHVIRCCGRGTNIYLTTNDLLLELAFVVIGLSVFVPTYSLRRRWNMLPESLIGPDYEKIRATYNDKMSGKV